MRTLAAELTRQGHAVSHQTVSETLHSLGCVLQASRKTHDTPEFADESIYCWWRQMGRKTCPQAHELLITADGSGSNGQRTRMWKAALQRMADATGLKIGLCHLPPGTSKRNNCSTARSAIGAPTFRQAELTPAGCAARRVQGAEAAAEAANAAGRATPISVVTVSR